MKAMILAAGRGSRLRPLTDRMPKPMVPIGSVPLLEHVVRLLAHHGFDDLVVNLHHLPEVIRHHFGDGRHFGVRLAYADEPQLLGTAGAVRAVAQTGFFHDEDFLVYYGDNLINANLTALWDDHQRHPGCATIGLTWMPDPHDRGIIGMTTAGRIDRLIEKPSAEDVFEGYQINAGVYALRSETLAWIDEGTPDFATDVFPPMLAAGRELYGHRLQGQLLSTDTPERYEATLKAVTSGHFQLP